MKIKKRITIVADILVDEYLDTNLLCICKDVTPQNMHETFVGYSDDFEVLDYISQTEYELENEEGN